MAPTYFDTGVFVTPLLKNRSDAVIDACRAWQERMRCGELKGITSYLTWDEVTHVAGRRHKSFSHADSSRAGELLLQLPNLSFVDVDHDVIAEAQRLLAMTHCRPRDAIHAATALLRAGGRLLTLDTDFTHSGVAGLQILPLLPEGDG